MIPQPEQRVKCIFRNGTIVEGIVEEWGQEVHLVSLTDNSLMIICHPDEDIMMIKIMADEAEEIIEDKDNSENNSTPIQDQIRTKIKEVIVPQEDPELQRLSITDLKRLADEQERQIIAKKIKQHFPSAYAPHKPNYGSQLDLSIDRHQRKTNGKS